MFCNVCGKELTENGAYCEHCGASVAAAKENKKKTNTLAILGCELAGISLIFNLLGLVGIAAIILSTLGLIQINERNEKGRGMAIAGITIGGVSSFFAAVTMLSIIMPAIFD